MFSYTHSQTIQHGNQLYSAELDSLIQSNLHALGLPASLPGKHKVQIILTQLNRDEEGVPNPKHLYWRLDTTEYFNPASLVKLPAAVIALEKIHLLGIEGLDKYSRMETLADYGCQYSVKKDPSSASGYPSIAHYIRKMFLVSDNRAYSRIYEFLGQSHLTTRLWGMGYTNAIITRRFQNCTEKEDRRTNPINFYNETGELVYEQPSEYNRDRLRTPLSRKYKAGNFISLLDLHRILISIVKPDISENSRQFVLDPDDYTFLWRHMSMLPRESESPRYDPAKYYDGYVKYLFSGRGKSAMPENLRIYNKVGMSGGYLSDVAYFNDNDSRIDFFLSAVVYCPQDPNGGGWTYYTYGFPFLKKLGELIYKYELGRNQGY